ncbi:hypothetical protein [Kyrpidia tusciae]|uniref:hypothetical protein n=1 Tax=Kyrpidia tusciae TaxID=33943 RepID=UPI00059B8D36|nr:hypothetical protein [Kyrpidia tusciae]
MNRFAGTPPEAIADHVERLTSDHDGIAWVDDRGFRAGRGPPGSTDRQAGRGRIYPLPGHCASIHHGSHVEFAVENRDRRFTCVIGPSGSGYFLALPEHHLCLTFRELEDLPGLGETVFSCSHLSGQDKSACLSAVQALVKYDLLF